MGLFNRTTNTTFQSAGFIKSDFNAVREKPTKAAKVDKQHKRINANNFLDSQVQKALSSEPSSRIKTRLYKSEAHRKAVRRKAAKAAQQQAKNKRK